MLFSTTLKAQWFSIPKLLIKIPTLSIESVTLILVKYYWRGKLQHIDGFYTTCEEQRFIGVKYLAECPKYAIVHVQAFDAN